VLWFMAVGVGCFAGIPATSAVASPNEPGFSFGHAIEAAIERSTALKDARADEIDAPGWFGSVPMSLVEEQRVSFALSELMTLPRMRLDREASLRSAAATSTVAAAAPGLGMAGGPWLMAAAYCVYGAEQTRTSPAEQEERVTRRYTLENEYLAAAWSSVPRRSKDLFVGALQRRFDDPSEDLLPSKHSEMFAMYPSPGGAAVGLLAGACCLGRRRR